MVKTSSASPPAALWPLLALAFAAIHTHPTHAYPSKGLDVPNGERVPCPDDDTGCLNGICRGLGHGTCAGGYVSPNLNPFGVDLKEAGFEWTSELCQADSDGDGFSNGEELGDPCCMWTKGAGIAPYTAAFVPSHPGDADHALPDDYVRPQCGMEDTTPPDDGLEGSTGTAAFNPGERQGSFEFRVKDYPIPQQTTTYVDFVFNLPEDLPEIVHIVYGEAIVSQPKHLHHFVVTGCASRIDESLDGLPLEQVPEGCNIPIGGFAGWAPGVTMWDNPTNAGVAIGPKFGIKAIQLNVHYTDGAAPYLNGKQAIATDGVKVYYTPDLRPKTLVAIPIIQVGFGPSEMVVQPNKTRAFMTRTCTVKSRCTDLDDKTMKFIGARMLNDSELTCESGSKKYFCVNDMFQMSCPESCGLCAEGSPRNPDEWHAVGVGYHAHLLGREMYTTLLPKDDQNERIDLRSRDIWSYDDQTPFVFDGITIRPGDKFQTTCIFDSTSRTEPTRFDLSTYDEMCINSVGVIFDTPAFVEGAATTAANEVFLRAFRCDTSETGDIWMGELGFEEDAREIIDAHPLEDATCSFPTGLWVFDGIPTHEMRCNGEIVADEREGICAGLPGTVFNPGAAAGSTCNGGTLNEKDANDGTTEAQCTTGGGQWKPYTCYEAQRWLESSSDLDSEIKQYLREYWWQPKCCIGASEIDGEDEETMEDENPQDDTASTPSAAHSITNGGVSFVTVIFIVLVAVA